MKSGLIPHLQNAAADMLTYFHVLLCQCLDLLCELAGAGQVLEHVDVWTEADHRLLTAPCWELNQVVKV